MDELPSAGSRGAGGARVGRCLPLHRARIGHADAVAVPAVDLDLWITGEAVADGPVGRSRASAG